MPGRPRPAADGENLARFDSNVTGLWHSASRRRLGVTTAAAQWREQPGPPATGRGFPSPPSVRRCWNCASVTHGFISVGRSYIAAACCVALVVVVARLPRCRDGAFIFLSPAPPPHIYVARRRRLCCCRALCCLMSYIGRGGCIPVVETELRLAYLKTFPPLRGAARCRAAAVAALWKKTRGGKINTKMQR